MKRKFFHYLASFIFIAGVFLMTNSSCTPDKPLEWPEVTKETKPWSRWWWLGSGVREPDLTASMQQYADAGLGGLEITPIYGARGYEDRFIDFLSPEWMKELTFTLQEAKRLDLGIDLANASGWPFGGPWVDDLIACKYMAYKVYKLKGGESLSEQVKYMQEPIARAIGKRVGIKDIKEPVTANQNLQEYAFDQIRYGKDLPIIVVTATSDKGEVVNVTDKVGANGRLDWVAPAGEWTVCALFQGWHGKMVERASPGGEGNVIDHFSLDAINAYLKKFDEAFKGHDLSYLRYYFNDSYEVDDAQGESDWTPKFFDEFKALRGYDLRDYLPALLGLDTEERNSRIRYDYRLTINDLLLERYSKPWQAWAAKQGKGIRNQAHGSPANVLDLYAVSDVPEIEGTDIINIKGAPSAAHVTGKKLVSSESATWLGEHFESSLGDVKVAMDRFLLGGVNHTFYHGTCFSPQDVPWPGWLFYAAVHFNPNNSFWPDFGAFNAYITRCQSFLQAGKPNNDILVYYAISDIWSRPDRAMLQHFAGLDRMFNNTPLRNSAQEMQNNGYAWDLISDKQISGIAVANGDLATGGVLYKTLFLPECNVIPLETLETVMNLAKSGATIIVHKNMPLDVAGFAGLDEKRAKLNELLSQLDFKNGENVRTAVYGKGKIIIADEVGTLLNAAGIRREAMYDSGLNCIRREKDNGGVYYFIVNNSDKYFDGWVPVSSPAKAMAIHDPMRNVNGYAKIRTTEAVGKEVYIQLQPRESVIVETFTDRRKGAEFVYYQESGEKQSLTGPWNLTFTLGGPQFPASQTLTELGSWTEYEDNSYKIFSGSGEYTVSLPALQGDADAWKLDLGNVGESAAIYVNGQYLVTLFAAPFVVDINKDLLKGDDKLTVRVSNSMANRIIDLDKRSVDWKIFYNTNFPARRRENSNEKGYFDGSKWEPKVSGLIGPVTLTPMTALK
jgi:hypothetical protein